MMAAMLFLFFTATASAQITTSFIVPQEVIGTDKVSYEASVVGADGDHVTLAAHFANDSDYEALGLVINSTNTYTLASTMFEYSVPNILHVTDGPPSGDAYSMSCDKQVSAATAHCSFSYGAQIARASCRQTYDVEGRTSTVLWTYSNTDEQGVETIVRSYPAMSSNPPDWCSGPENSYGEISVPDSAKTFETTVSAEYFGTFDFIITAGEEKLSATTGGAASPTTAEPTGSSKSDETGAAATGGDEEETSSGSDFTGAAVPMKTAAPALAGIGVAAMGYFL